MTVARTIEVTSTPKKSFDDAIKVGVAKAAETLANITGAWVMVEDVEISKGKVTQYRVRMKQRFVLKELESVPKMWRAGVSRGRPERRKRSVYGIHKHSEHRPTPGHAWAADFQMGSNPSGHPSLAPRRFPA